MGTQQWYFTNHLPAACQDVNGAKYRHDGDFEGVHKLIKHIDSKSSKRKGTAMDEFMNRQNYLLLLQKMNSVLTWKELCISQCRSHAVAHDSSITAWHSVRTTIPELEETLLKQRSERGIKISFDFEKPYIEALQTALGIDGHCTLCKLPNEHFKETYQN